MHINKINFKKYQFHPFITIISVVITVVIIAKTISFFAQPKIDTTAGLETLSYMDQLDIDQIEFQIDTLEEAERIEAEEWENRTPNEKFSNSVVMGDSITQGLYEYGILDESHVIADRGTEISKISTSKIDEHISMVINLYPQTIFLAYGLNDLTVLNGNCDFFKQQYQIIIQQIKESLPDTKIYINSILPVEQFVIDSNNDFQYIPQFNEKLKELCIEENIIYIDNTSLIHPEYYANDGIHLSPSYYPEWVNHMAEVAEL